MRGHERLLKLEDLISGLSSGGLQALGGMTAMMPGAGRERQIAHEELIFRQ